MFSARALFVRRKGKGKDRSRFLQNDKYRWFCVLLLTSVPLAAFAQKGSGLRVVANEAARRVDVTFDGQPFTSYVWPMSLKKPVIYPLITPNGVTVSRGYPLAPLAGERVDHPHHAGMWFNYGNVNGFDFWNNSDAIKPEDRAKMGSIEQGRIVSVKSGTTSGELVVETLWRTGTGTSLLRESTRLLFTHRVDSNVIDRVTTLTALDRAVFHDDKEGLLGIRVASFLESANEKGGIFNDANGVPTKVAAVSNSTANGVYLTSEGKQGEAVWGTRGRWCVLNGTTPADARTGSLPVAIGIYDYPGNPGAPTYWHARGYGLFAANPLGRSIFDTHQEPYNFTLAKGEAATFRYRVVLYAHAVSSAQAEQESKSFSSNAN